MFELRTVGGAVHVEQTMRAVRCATQVWCRNCCHPLVLIHGILSVQMKAKNLETLIAVLTE